MKKTICILVIISVIFMTFPVNSFALQYRYEDWDYEFDDAGYWVNGWCYRPLDEKTAILVAYDQNIIKGEELIIPEIINGYSVTGFAHGIFRWSSFKKCDLSHFPILSKRMFEESALESVVLSKDTKIIPDGCFLDCPIEKIELPEGLETIEAYSFRGTKLKEIVFPSTVKNLEFQVVSYCPELKIIEFKNGALTNIEESSFSLGSTFMVENLEALILPENITHIGENEFKVAEAGRHGFSFIKHPDNLTVYGKKGSYAESYANEHELSFKEIEEAIEYEFIDYGGNKVVSKNIYAIECLEKELYSVKVMEIIETEYGTVMYYSIGGMPHGPYSRFLIVDYEGNEHYFEGDPVPAATVYGSDPMNENIKISDDGRYLTFSVSFEDRLVSTLGDTPQVFHDAGTYYFKCDLKEHTRIETHFEPKDTLGENVISTWAKPEIEKAIGLGLVPNSFRENYTRNITRGEFAKLAIFFLQMQYGYGGVPAVQVWSPTGYSDNTFVKPQFMNAYCATHTDRNGNPFRDKYETEDYQYHNTNVEIKLPEMPFDDVDEYSKDFDFIERAYHIGIVNGLSETVFNPDGDITRQEAAAMLMRVYKNYAKVENKDNAYLFADDEAIADWAKEDVYAINGLGVMQGIGDDTFAPLDNYTIEQAIATFVRLYEFAPVSRKNKNITPLLDCQYESTQYFHREGGSYFHETERKEYENFIMVGGYWTQRHTTSTFEQFYFFSKTGGMIFSVDPSQKWELSPDEKRLTVMVSIGDTFRLFHKLNGTEKVYSKGEYLMKFDLDTGILIEFEKVA